MTTHLDCPLNKRNLAVDRAKKDESREDNLVRDDVQPAKKKQRLNTIACLPLR